MLALFFETHRRFLVISLLLAFFGIGLFTMINDAGIVDEIAHIPAGYSYMAYGDYRLNPEHPPLIKDLAGLFLLPLQPAFPLDHISWQKDINGQWEAGWHFLYHYGNNADLILFFSRLPILLLGTLFGLIIYLFCAKHFGTKTGLLALFFYSFSPNIIAHSHFVTTDLGIAFFIFLSLIAFGAFLKSPAPKTLFWATLGLAGAQAAKFSAVLLIPFYLLMLILLFYWNKQVPKLKFPWSDKVKNRFWKRAVVFISAYLIIIFGSVVMVWVFYALHTYNFPPEKQIELIRASLPAEEIKLIREALVGLSWNKITQPLAQYLLGVAMVFARVAGGNTTYFLGEVTNQSFKLYFPASYFLKTPLAFLILLTLALMIGLMRVYKLKMKKIWVTLKKNWTKYPYTISFLLFIIYYFGISVAGNLNLGIRHLFPIIPLIFILVSKRMVIFVSSFKSALGKKLAAGFLGLMIFWFGLSTLAHFPHYVSYHNEIIGGGKNAYWYFTDSNVDWGQDLKRFKDWLADHPEIEKIKLDYFGGGEPKYNFCSRQFDHEGNLVRTSAGYDCTNSVYQEWHAQYGPAKGWIAVSATFMQNARWYTLLHGQPDYDWLRFEKPYAIVGNSILVYRIK